MARVQTDTDQTQRQPQVPSNAHPSDANTAPNVMRRELLGRRRLFERAATCAHRRTSWRPTCGEGRPRKARARAARAHTPPCESVHKSRRGLLWAAHSPQAVTLVALGINAGHAFQRRTGRRLSAAAAVPGPHGDRPFRQQAAQISHPVCTWHAWRIQTNVQNESLDVLRPRAPEQRNGRVMTEATTPPRAAAAPLTHRCNAAAAHLECTFWPWRAAMGVVHLWLQGSSVCGVPAWRARCPRAFRPQPCHARAGPPEAATPKASTGAAAERSFAFSSFLWPANARRKRAMPPRRRLR